MIHNAKREKVSVNSLILSAMANAMKALSLSSEPSKLHLPVQIPVDMRRYGKFVGEIGNIVGDIRFCASYGDTSPQFFHNAFTERLKGNQPFWVLQALSEGGKNFPHKEKILPLQTLPLSMGLTNMGVLGGFYLARFFYTSFQLFSFTHSHIECK